MLASNGARSLIAAAALLAAWLGAGNARAAVDFADVPPAHWAAADVRELAAAGVVVGFPDGTFHGDRPLTRYELSVVLARADALLAAQAAGSASKVELDELQKRVLGLERRVAALELRLDRGEGSAPSVSRPGALVVRPFAPLRPPLGPQPADRYEGAAGTARLLRARAAALAPTASQTDLDALRPSLTALSDTVSALERRAATVGPGR